MSKPKRQAIDIIEYYIFKKIKKKMNIKVPNLIYEKLNITKEQLKNQIEIQFEDWMNWGNCKEYREYLIDSKGIEKLTWRWNIGHKIDYIINDTSDDEDFKKHWDISNLFPQEATTQYEHSLKLKKKCDQCNFIKILYDDFNVLSWDEDRYKSTCKICENISNLEKQRIKQEKELIIKQTEELKTAQKLAKQNATHKYCTGKDCIKGLLEINIKNFRFCKPKKDRSPYFSSWCWDCEKRYSDEYIKNNEDKILARNEKNLKKSRDDYLESDRCFQKGVNKVSLYNGQKFCESCEKFHSIVDFDLRVCEINERGRQLITKNHCDFATKILNRKSYKLFLEENEFLKELKFLETLPYYFAEKEKAEMLLSWDLKYCPGCEEIHELEEFMHPDNKYCRPYSNIRGTDLYNKFLSENPQLVNAKFRIIYEAYQQYKKNIHERNKSIGDFRRSISHRIKEALEKKKKHKDSSIFKYLPYSLRELSAYIEVQFKLPGNEWMNWNNQGAYVASKWDDNDKTTWLWNIDHIIPHSEFKYDSLDHPDFVPAWDLSNLRPLNAKQNVIDGARRTRHQEKHKKDTVK